MTSCRKGQAANLLCSKKAELDITTALAFFLPDASLDLLCIEQPSLECDDQSLVCLECSN